MDDFFGYGDWFTTKYEKCSGERFPTFKMALNIFHQKGFKTIVETGTTRMANDWGAGMSTILFADYVHHYGGEFHTVDILPSAIETCKEVTAEFKDCIDYVVSDSISYLYLFPKKIDLLYLDSMDCPIEDKETEELIRSQKHQKTELETAWDKLSDGAIVLLDDNWFANGGKCRMSKGYLVEKGWTCLYDQKQSLWIKV